MASLIGELSECRRRLARIRCVQDCVECFKLIKPLPQALCFIPAEVEYRLAKPTSLLLFQGPSKKSEKASEVPCSADTRVYVSGEELCNAEGLWSKVIKVQNLSFAVISRVQPPILAISWSRTSPDLGTKCKQ